MSIYLKITLVLIAVLILSYLIVRKNDKDDSEKDIIEDPTEDSWEDDSHTRIENHFH